MNDDDVMASVVLMLDSVDWKPTGLDPRDYPGKVVTYEGELVIDGFRLRCYQLGGGERVFDADDVAEFFGLDPLVGEPLSTTSDDVVTSREPGCPCQWEEGDSPCPVHGEDDE